MKAKKKANPKVIKLNPKLIVEEVLETKDTILTLAQESSSISIDLSNIEAVDTFGIQLLISVLQSQTLNKINFINTTETFKSACNKIGFEYQKFEAPLEITI